jgi:hypothetical protein
MAKSFSDRRPRIETVSPDQFDDVIAKLEDVQNELRTVVARMRQLKLKNLTVTGWGKFDRATSLLTQFTGHAEYAIKTAPVKS